MLSSVSTRLIARSMPLKLSCFSPFLTLYVIPRGTRLLHSTNSFLDVAKETESITDATGNSIQPDEITKFSELASHWWNPSGPFRPLHEMNPVRLGYIRSALSKKRSTLTSQSAKPLEGLSILDIGCGGGLLAEPLARLGGSVLGIDAAKDSVKAALAHRLLDDRLANTLHYQCCTAESLVAGKHQYDVVIASEIIEHVNGPNEFLRTCKDLLKPTGTLIVSTINRTPQAFSTVIVGAEYIARCVPAGTHHYMKFIKPEEMVAMLTGLDMELDDISGMNLNILTHHWSVSTDLDVNYILTATKKPLRQEPTKNA